MTDGREIVRTLEQELDASHQRCTQIERAISSLRELYGITGDVDDEAEESPAPVTRRGGKPGPKPRAAGKKKGGARAAVPNEETRELGDRIVAALKRESPQRPGELAVTAKIKLKGYAYRALLSKLADAGRIVRSGNGRGAIVSLRASRRRRNLDPSTVRGVRPVDAAPGRRTREAVGVPEPPVPDADVRAARVTDAAPAATKTWPCTGGCGKGMPAPGAKCPECILAKQRARQITGIDLALAKSPEEAQARDRALLDLLQHGPARFERLLSVMPGTFPSEAARESACRSTLLRLKVKKAIQIVPEGYALA